MLLWSARILAFLAKVENRGHISWTIKNALLNTFAIHARNLTLFLYPGSNRYPTDVVIEDYINQYDLTKNLPPISKILEKVINKANKQVGFSMSSPVVEWCILSLPAAQKVHPEHPAGARCRDIDCVVRI